MKSTFLFLSFLLCVGIADAQKVKLKKEIVTVNGKEFLTYKKIDMNTLVLFETGKEDEIIQITRLDNETEGINDDYVKIHFIEKNLKLESNAIGRRSWEYYIEWMIKNKVFTSDGILNKDKIDQIVARYDENITSRTIRKN